MTLEQWSWAAQVLGSAGVVLSLLFVGFQIRQNTSQLQRAEHNSTMAQWSTIRMALVESPELADLWARAIERPGKISEPERLRLEAYLAEYLWAAFHIWDRTQRGVFPKGTFEATGGFLVAQFLGKPRAQAWWSAAKAGFLPPFAADVDALLARG